MSHFSFAVASCLPLQNRLRASQAVFCIPAHVSPKIEGKEPLSAHIEYDKEKNTLAVSQTSPTAASLHPSFHRRKPLNFKLSIQASQIFGTRVAFPTHVSQRLWKNSPERYKGIVFCEKIRSRVSPASPSAVSMHLWLYRRKPLTFNLSIVNCQLSIHVSQIFGTRVHSRGFFVFRLARQARVC